MITIEFCIETMRGALEMSDQALQTELAIGLAVISSNIYDGMLNAKRVLAGIYASCGADCATPEGRRYKTVRRKVGAIADLYEHLRTGKRGASQVDKWIKGKPEQEAVAAIKSELGPYSLQSMDDVMELVGKPRAERRQDETREDEPETQEDTGNVGNHPMRRATDVEAPGTIHIRGNGHLDIAVPPEATAEELKQAGEELFRLAFERDNAK